MNTHNHLSDRMHSVNKLANLPSVVVDQFVERIIKTMISDELEQGNTVDTFIWSVVTGGLKKESDLMTLLHMAQLQSELVAIGSSIDLTIMLIHQVEPLVSTGTLSGRAFRWYCDRTNTKFCVLLSERLASSRTINSLKMESCAFVATVNNGTVFLPLPVLTVF